MKSETEPTYVENTPRHTFTEGEWVETIYGRGKITYIRNQTGGVVYETTIGEFFDGEIEPIGEM